MSLIEKAVAQQAQNKKRGPTPQEPFIARQKVTKQQSPQIRPVTKAEHKETKHDDARPAPAIEEAVAPARAQRSTAPRLRLNFTELMNKGFLSPENHLQTRHHEEYRFIKRKLLHNAFAANGKLVPRGNLIMVTSCHPKEGKTFNAVNLALSIALERDKTVLLIDGDVIKPSLHSTLGFTRNQPGLLNFLDGSVDDLGDIIYSTNLENLKLVPAGTQHALSNELLASRKMQMLMEDMVARYPDRMIIVDSPPLLGVSDTHVLTQYVGQAVFIISYGKTMYRDVEQGLNQLPEGLAVGFIMNRSDNEHGEPYDYYYGIRERTVGEHDSVNYSRSNT